jgi:MOSC domain-containing protein YiiM
MDEARKGLRRALEPDMRAGVWGRVLTGGTIRLGDRVLVVPGPGRP